MVLPEHITHNPKPKNPQEELSELHSRVEEKEKQYEEAGSSPEKEDVVSETVDEYRDVPTEDVLDNDFAMSEAESEELALDLKPEEHDEKMSELLGQLMENGFKNTLSVVRKMEDKHIEDDFHRVLVQYLKEGHALDGIQEKNTLYQALNMTLYKVILPAPDSDEQQKSLSELISAMEQFYAGMLSVESENSSGADYFTLELAVEHVGEALAFYCAVNDEDQDLFEKHITSVFPRAEVVESKDDYNMFHHGGESAVSVAEYSNKCIFPIKTYEKFDHDPLNAILNAFSKLDKEGEGAAIQFVIKPARGKYEDRYKRAIKQIENGKDVEDAIDIAFSVLGEMGKELKKGIKRGFEEFMHGSGNDDDEDTPIGSEAQEAIEQIQEKLDAPIVRTNIRLITSGKNERDATHILSGLESAFNQFENTKGNSLTFSRLSGKNKETALHRFAFRLFSADHEVPLNTREISSLFHFPVIDSGSRELQESEARTAPAPLEMPDEGIVVGINKHRGRDTKVRMTKEDRLRHYYVVGQTGTGKSTLLTNMIKQDIQNGEGCCFIDPHGSDVQDILASVPEERYEDVIYFDPAHTARPMALNMLEYDQNYPEQKTFVVNEMLSIFKKLFDMQKAGGPMFEQYFRNATMLVLEDPDSGSTLLEISRVLADKEFREMKLSKSNNPMVNQFWEEVAGKAGGEASLENIVPYITSKFDNFLQNEIMRPIIAQENSSFDFRNIMDEQKILLVNLSKGRLGEINANLLGLILVGKILMAALSRVDVAKSERIPFYLYIDEFQNVTTDSISQILSEARKYGLSLNMAHQFIAQLDDGIRDSVFGNVGSMAAYRVSSDDAEFLESQFAPTFKQRDLMNLDNYTFITKMLVNGVPTDPFTVSALPPDEGNTEIVDKLKRLSYTKFGRPREEVEADIMERYKKTKNTTT